MNMNDSYYKHECVCSYHCFIYMVAHFTQCSVIYSKLSTSVHKQHVSNEIRK